MSHHTVVVSPPPPPGGQEAPGQPLSDEDVQKKMVLVESLKKRKQELLAKIASIGAPHQRTLSDPNNTSSLATIGEGSGSATAVDRQAALPTTPSSFRPAKLNVFAIIRGGLVTQLIEGLGNGTISVHARDYNQCTPLHIAAYEGRRDMINVLLQYGADLTATDSEGRTASDLALRNKTAGTAIRSDLLAASTRVGGVGMSVTGGGEGNSYGSTASGGQGVPGGGLGSGKQTLTSNNNLMVGASFDDLATLPSDYQPPGKHSTDIANSSDGKSGVEGNGVSHANCIDNNCNISTPQGASQYCTISDSKSVVVMMVGLPGRGKSFISTRIRRYMNWHGIPCRVFNAGDYRRDHSKVEDTRKADFFDDSNADAQRLRERYAEMASEDLCSFLHLQSNNGRTAVGILDATNTTVKRREKMIKYFSAEVPDARILFVESVCDDDLMITENIIRSKCNNNDWKGMSPEEVIRDFKKRIENYNARYEPLDEKSEDVSFIKIRNVKEQRIMHKVVGGIPTRLTYFLLNLHPVAFPIYLSMPGQTVWQRDGLFGGEENLTQTGNAYARQLADFVKERVDSNVPLTILYAMDASCVATVEAIKDTIFGPQLDSISVLASPNSPSAASGSANSSSFVRASLQGAGASGRHADPFQMVDFGSSMQEVAGNAEERMADSISSASSTAGGGGRDEEGGEGSKPRVRFAAMQCLNGINYGTFVGKSAPEAWKEFPKIFEKLFGESQVKRAKDLYEREKWNLANQGSNPRFNTAAGIAPPQGIAPIIDFGLGGGTGGGNASLGATPPVLLAASANSNSLGMSPGERPGLASLVQGQSVGTEPPGAGSPPPLLTPSSSAVEQFVPQYQQSFPRGESARQVTVRLERAMLELMRLDGPVMVIAPRHAVQGLRGFFSDRAPEFSHEIVTHLHTVYEQGTSGKVTHQIGANLFTLGASPSAPIPANTSHVELES